MVNFSTARQARGKRPAARATLSASPMRNGVTPSEIAFVRGTLSAAASHRAPKV